MDTIICFTIMAEFKFIVMSLVVGIVGIIRLSYFCAHILAAGSGRPGPTYKCSAQMNHELPSCGWP